MSREENEKRVKQEFDKLVALFDKNTEFLNENYTDCFKIFKHIYLINHFKNRAETKRFFNTNFDIAFSLMLESIYALYSGHIRAALLLLRSAQEMTLKSIIYQERNWIKTKKENVSFEDLSFRFLENKTIFIKDITPYLNKTIYADYFSKLDKTVTIYKELSGIVHSSNKSIDFNLYQYFSSIIYKKSDINKFLNLFMTTLRNLLDLICYMMRDSLKLWDTYELKDLLSIIIKKEKSRINYINRIRGNENNSKKYL